MVLIDFEVFIDSKIVKYDKDQLKNLIENFSLETGSDLRVNVRHQLPSEFVSHFRACIDNEFGPVSKYLRSEDVTKRFYFVTTDETSPFEENIEASQDGEATSVSLNWILPSWELDGQWESLYLSDNIKNRLLYYVMACIELARKKVDQNIILCNRLVLLHGPPGTGKTTICKAIAQKLSIRLYDSFHCTQLVEINCHSLFSKWFSESGKLVVKMFNSITQLASNPGILVVVLIDEVESLTAARQSAVSGTEPSDAIRVVNAVLTQLDVLRRLPNVLVMATSNLTEAMDPAFTDRADFIQFIGYPSPAEVNQILHSCFTELERSGLFESGTLTKIDASPIAEKCAGLSGRAIRKLPLLAYAESHTQPVCPESFMLQLNIALERLWKNKKLLKVHQNN